MRPIVVGVADVLVECASQVAFAEAEHGLQSIAPHERVARLIRAAGGVGCCHLLQARATVADPTYTSAVDLVARDFTAPASDQLWLGDITYVATQDGWLYLAVLLDALCYLRHP